ncbi:MAG: hypothetical protein WD847_18480 [Pirellulales bacterium]
MSNELVASLNRLVERIQELAGRDPQLRSELRSLAMGILDALADKQPADAGQPPEISAAAEAPSAQDESVELPDSSPAETADARGLAADARLPAEDRFDGRVAGAKAGWPAAWLPISDDDLPLIEERCRLKAEAARWAADRQRRLVEGAAYKIEIEPRDQDLIRRAKALPDCFLWMSHRDGPSPVDLTLLDNLAGCFETVAASVALVRSVLNDPDAQGEFFEQALDLLAESQSALRSAVNMIEWTMDSDQVKLFTWLKSAAQQHQIFIERHMRADDPADPTRWEDIDARIGLLDQKIEQARQRRKQEQARIKRVRYHVKLIRGGDPGEHHWRKVAETLDELVSDGMPPSNREIRELLLPVVDHLPELPDPPAGFRLVRREIDRFLAIRPAAAQPDSRPEPTADVREAVRLLAGRNVVMIGGERRPHAQELLRSALELGDLIWLEAKEHQPLEMFEPYVSRPDVVLVLLAIRWSSHSFGEIRQFCERHGKPLVRLPAGYNPNQVAAQILSQCSKQLEAVASR